MFDHVDAMRASVVVLHLVDANGKYPALKNPARFDCARQWIHLRDLAERSDRAS